MSTTPAHDQARTVEPAPRRTRRIDRELAAAGRHGLLPIPGALLIDAVDLATFGPVGLLGGALLGGSLALLVARRHRLSRLASVAAAALGALYCSLPFTELLPLATALAVTSQLLDRASATPGHIPGTAPIPAGGGARSAPRSSSFELSHP